jgi:hypothetical protein
VIYLLHSTVSLGTTGRNAGCHYIGYCEDGRLWQRMKEHHTGKSKVSIIRAYQEAGATLYLVRVWPDGGQALERHLKNRGHYRSHCPICSNILKPEQAVSIELALTLVTPPAVLRSRRLMSEAEKSNRHGTDGYRPGLSVQLAIQVPNGWSGSDAGLTLASPGGRASRVVVRTSPQDGKSVGTKPPLFDSGKTLESASTPANPRRLSLAPPGPTPRELQLELGLADEEVYQV